MFDLDAFVHSPSLDELESFKKSDIIVICKHYQLECKASMVKSTLVKLIAQHLVDEQIGGEDFQNLIDSGDQDRFVKLKELENKSKELELKSRELELRSLESERDHDLQREKLAIERDKMSRDKKERVYFEKVASNLEWPKESWTSLLQTVFTGKARQAYNDLSDEKSKDYETVKQTVLKVYELIPEAYRLKFRARKMSEGETHVEFVRNKERLFDKWVKAKNICGDYEKFRQLMLLEEIKQCIHPDIQLFLDDQEIGDIYGAAEKADYYSLTHKISNKSYKQSSSYRPVKHDYYQNNRDSNRNFLHQRDSVDYKPSNTPANYRPKECSYCYKKGHNEHECYKKLRQQNTHKPKPLQCTAIQKGCHDSVNEITPSKTLHAPVQDRETKVPRITANDKVLKYSYDDVQNDFRPFLFDGFVSSAEGENKTPIRILRDTGSSKSLLLKNVIDLNDASYTGHKILIQGVNMECSSIPLHIINLECDLINKNKVTVGVVSSLPCEGISLLLGNDLAGGKVVPDVITSDTPSKLINNDVCNVVTRSSHKVLRDVEVLDNSHDLENTFMNTTDEDIIKIQHLSCNKAKIIIDQQSDDTLKQCYNDLVPFEELDDHGICYYLKDGLLMRKYRPSEARADEAWRIINQIVLPQCYRTEVISMAHDIPLAGHLGVNKTNERILAHFFWPGIRQTVAQHCKTCHICQIVGKPNQKIQRAPLQPIPAFEEPFSKVIIDCVSPLPKTKSGNEYLLTIMCSTTRFPEAIPMRNIKAKKIVSHLIKFFTFVGLPKVIQSDLGSNFMSNIFKQVVTELGIKHYTSSAYHPESQGALERFHQTLKNMMRTYCTENKKDWDEGIHLLLFASRESVQDSLGYSPFELIFGHTVRGPLKLLKEQFMSEDKPRDLLTYVCTFKDRLQNACEIANNNLKQTQKDMKSRYDKNTKVRVFKPGDKVLIFLPIQGRPLNARYQGPYEIESCHSPLNYLVKTPDRRKSKQLCHVT